MGNHEPQRQGKLRTVHDRSGGDRGLSPASAAFPGELFTRQLPGLHATAARTNEAVRPSLAEQILGAGSIVRKPPRERDSGHRSVVFPAACHENKLATLAAASQPASCP